jgi:metal-responsive CopG/Arc/MetJ family transcriptional regulator
MLIVTKRPQISVTIPAWVLEAVDEEAERLGVTRSALVSLALSEYLRAQQQREENG